MHLLSIFCFALLICGIVCPPGWEAKMSLVGRGDQYGCVHNYCWARCAFFGLDLLRTEWCYTTKGSSLDFNYVACNTDEQCNPTWNCAGMCNV